MTLIHDAISIGTQRKRTAEGFLSAPAVIGRVGVLPYAPTDSAVADAPEELKRANRPIRMLRPELEVFKPESMQSFAGRPVLNEHSTAKVTPENYRDHLVGVTGSSIVRDGDSLCADLMIYDAPTIAEIDNGKAQLSQGYDAKTEWVSGSDPVYGEYDGRFTNIIGNHIALTLRGRSGPNVRILDADKNNGVQTVKRNIKGVEIEIPDTVVGVVDSYISDNATVEKNLAKTTTDLATANGKIAALEKQIEDDKKEIARVTDSAYVDAQVKERATLIETAKRLAPAVVCDSLSNEAIRAAVVVARGIKVDGKDAINGAFAALVSMPENAQAKVVTDSLNGNAKPVKSAEEMYNEARAKYLAGNREVH